MVKEENLPHDSVYVQEEVFEPIYRELALAFSKIVEPNYVCLDIGTGIGFLPLYLQKVSNYELKILVLDKSKRIKEIRSFLEPYPSERVIPIRADAKILPIKAETIDFVMSRGFIPHLELPIETFNEVERVLKGEGKIAIGGTLGLRTSTREKVLKSMTEEMRSSKPEIDKKEIQEALQKSDLEGCEISEGKHGFWITRNLGLDLGKADEMETFRN